MTVPARRSRGATVRTGVVLRVLLAVALLAPVGVLFTSTWRDNDDRRSVIELERHGVEYLRALEPVMLALVDARAGAVAGRPVDAGTLHRAVEHANAVNGRLGAELRATERWTGVRTTIQALPKAATADPVRAAATYGETVDLLVALYAKVRQSSGLARDQAADSFHLQDAVADELPRALDAAGRLADLVVLASRRSSAAQPEIATTLALARAAAMGPATDLLNNLRAAVENTESRTLGGNLLSRLDSYQRTVEVLDALATPAGGTEFTLPEPARVASARAAAQVSGAELATIIHTELDTLLRNRADDLSGERWIGFAALTLAVLLVLALIVLTLLAARQRVPAGAAGTTAEAATGAVPADGSGTTSAGSDPPPGPARTGPSLTESPLIDPSLLDSPLLEPPSPGVQWADPIPVGQVRQPVAALRDNQAGSPLRDSQAATALRDDRPVPAGPEGLPGPGPREDRATQHWGRPDAAR
ncbi:hypothetical protein [Plantactinospora sonchi]|uniref:Nitrate/nitrite sensing protein domain-containing protein n=1 Tax=Plantactinospora sonchi TaxID=1544735 RepID=A0ABU7RRT7_9ACTN